MDNKEWFKQAKFGMMIHWGLYCIPAGEWKGQRMPYPGEWIQSYFRIPNKEYHALANTFNPILFDADEYVRLAKDSGMQYMVFTSKHHEGFAMYKSDVSAFNMVDATPFKRDVVGELAEACYKHGLKFGLYYSEELDWSDPNGGGYTRGKTWVNNSAYWTNNWDYPDDAHKDFSQCFENKIKPQIKEILTKYGDLCLIWFDTPYDITAEQSRELYDMVKHYQPDCLVNSRIGNGLGDYRSTGDNQVEFEKGQKRSANVGQARKLEEQVQTGLYECPATLNKTWGYVSFDNEWKSAEQIISLKESLNGKGINYLLNVGPDYLGRIPAPSQDILREVGKRI